MKAATGSLSSVAATRQQVESVATELRHVSKQLVNGNATVGSCNTPTKRERRNYVATRSKPAGSRDVANHASSPSRLHREVFAEVDFAGERGGKNVFLISLNDNLPGGDDNCAVRDFKRIAHVVVGDENADVALREQLDHCFDVCNSDWVNAGERFVEQ